MDLDREVTFFPMEAIGEDGGLDTSRLRRLGDLIQGYTFLREGDVCLAKITPCFENGKGAIIRGTRNGIAFATTEVIPFRCDNPEDARFLFYALSAEPFRSDAEASMYGAGGQKRVSESFVANYKVALPSSDLRARISDFLDHELARIDALTLKQEQLIALLQEKRQTVISHAVTKGLNPDAPMRNSGVEWIGSVPRHWRCGKLKNFAELHSGHTPSRANTSYWENCRIPWFSLADVWQIRDGRARYLGETSEKISERGLAGSAAELLPAGTVVLSRTASVGYSGIMPEPMATTQDFANWVPGGDLSSEFLLYALRAMSPEFQRLKTGSTHKTIYMPDIQKLTAPVPPLREQEEIVSFLNHVLDEIDAASDCAGAMSKLLAERRTALISAAVTGQIDLRDWKPPKPNPEPASEAKTA